MKTRALHKILFYCLSVLTLNISLNAQWVNNTNENTKLVIDVIDPVNISVVDDSKGGTFIFWQDKKELGGSQVLFIHLDGSGTVSFRADGKKISQLPGQMLNPVSTASSNGTAVVLWKDYSHNTSGDLYLQKVTSNGNLLWSPSGLQLTNPNEEVNDYLLTSTEQGQVFVSYVAKSKNLNSVYSIKIKLINADGKVVGKDEGIVVHSSSNRKSNPNILVDEGGGVFIFWIESEKGKNVLYAQHINQAGKLLWGTKPLMVSSSLQSITTYSVQFCGDNKIYSCWQTQSMDKDIYHQLIDFKGNILWTGGGKLVTKQKGSQSNPQAVAYDNSIILSWTNEIKNEHKVFLQKFDLKGNSVWKNGPVNPVNENSDQFGQKIISDGKNGTVIAWIDKRSDSGSGDIYSQRINSSGELVWIDKGVLVGSHSNSLKSYLSLISDKRGGAIAIFKDTRNKESEIYGQKIFSTGTYISQIVGFKSELINDKIKISWYSANENGDTKYTIEKTSLADSGITGWQTVSVVNSHGKANANYYEYFDTPYESGTLYYRIVQNDIDGNEQSSEVSKIVYFKGADEIVVAQNSPNPFSDQTKISFYLPTPKRVTVEFFNNRIEKISEVSNQLFNAGENEITFSAKGLEPGIYFFRFKADEFVDVKKMMITK